MKRSAVRAAALVKSESSVPWPGASGASSSWTDQPGTLVLHLLGIGGFGDAASCFRLYGRPAQVDVCHPPCLTSMHSRGAHNMLSAGPSCSHHIRSRLHPHAQHLKLRLSKHLSCPRPPPSPPHERHGARPPVWLSNVHPMPLEKSAEHGRLVMDILHTCYSDGFCLVPALMLLASPPS